MRDLMLCGLSLAILLGGGFGIRWEKRKLEARAQREYERYARADEALWAKGESDGR